MSRLRFQMRLEPLYTVCSITLKFFFGSKWLSLDGFNNSTVTVVLRSTLFWLHLIKNERGNH